MSAHSAANDHEKVDEAHIRTGLAWTQHYIAKRYHREVMWSKNRPVPIGVTEDSWPQEVQP